MKSISLIRPYAIRELRASTSVEIEIPMNHFQREELSRLLYTRAEKILALQQLEAEITDTTTKIKALESSILDAFEYTSDLLKDRGKRSNKISLQYR